MRQAPGVAQAEGKRCGCGGVTPAHTRFCVEESELFSSHTQSLLHSPVAFGDTTRSPHATPSTTQSEHAHLNNKTNSTRVPPPRLVAHESRPFAWHPLHKTRLPAMQAPVDKVRARCQPVPSERGGLGRRRRRARAPNGAPARRRRLAKCVPRVKKRFAPAAGSHPSFPSSHTPTLNSGKRHRRAARLGQAPPVPRAAHRARAGRRAQCQAVPHAAAAAAAKSDARGQGKLCRMSRWTCVWRDNEGTPAPDLFFRARPFAPFPPSPAPRRRALAAPLDDGRTSGHHHRVHRHPSPAARVDAGRL